MNYLNVMYTNHTSMITINLYQHLNNLTRFISGNSYYASDGGKIVAIEILGRRISIIQKGNF